MAKHQTRDWSQLPLDLLQDIAGRLTLIADHLRFRCVCAQWRFASKSITNLPPQLPWLHFPAASTDGSKSNLFFSLAEKRIYRIPLSDFLNAGPNKIFPSSRGWIIINLRGSPILSLLNPLSHSLTPLLPLPPEFDLCRISQVKFLGSNLVAAAIVSASYGEESSISFCRGETSSWEKIDAPFTSRFFRNDIACHDGRFFIVNDIGAAVSVIDIDELAKTGEILIPTQRYLAYKYLVETHCGDLLLVLKKPRYFEGKKFELFRLDGSQQELKWVEVSGIEDTILFVDSDWATAFAAGDFNGWRGNCIYFLDSLDGPVESRVMVFDVGKGRIEETPLFSYDSQKHWGKDMWVVPTLG